MTNRPKRGYSFIQKAIKENDRNLLNTIKRTNRQHRGWYTMQCGLPKLTTFNSLDRLQEKGLVRYRKLQDFSKRGYWATALIK